MVRGHATVQDEDEARLIGAVRLAVWGSNDEVARAMDRRRGADTVDEGDDDGLAAACAEFGFRLEA